MTNILAIWLGVILVVIFGADGLLNDWSFTVAVMKRLVDLITYLAFWR